MPVKANDPAASISGPTKNNGPLNDWGWKQQSDIYAVADSGVALG